MSEQNGKAKPAAQSGPVDREARARMLWYKHQRLLRDEPASSVHAALAEVDPGFHYLEHLGWEPRDGDAKDGEWLSSWDRNGGLSTWLNGHLKRWRQDWLEKEAEKGAADKETAGSLGEGDDHDDDDDDDDDDHDDDSNGKDDGSENNDEQDQDQDQAATRSGTMTKPANRHGDQGLLPGGGGSTPNVVLPGVNDASTGRVPADRPEDASPSRVGNNDNDNNNHNPNPGSNAKGKGKADDAQVPIQEEPSSHPPPQAKYSGFYHWYRTVHRPAKKAGSGSNTKRSR
ncbi:hypothetical protein LY76DRAFT_338986 [Colletotrichum caudatum]|nr:hypothetical protein LY76DRAFT_338986 [Colletotrichum caudatum]